MQKSRSNESLVVILSGIKMIYQSLVIAIVIAWLLNQIGVFPRLLPTLGIPIFGTDIGFYLIYGLLYGVIISAFYFVEKSLGHPLWITQMRSRQGTAQFLDWCLLGISLLCVLAEIAAGVTSPYVVAIASVAMLGAIQSLLTGQERAFVEPQMPSQIELNQPALSGEVSPAEESSVSNDE